MKILIAISNSFAANFIKGQASYLIKKGHEVIIVSSYGVEIESLRKKENAKVIYIPFEREISILKDLMSLFYIIKMIYKEKPDIINAGNPKTGFLFSLARIFFFNTPLIFTLRGIRSDTLSGIKKRIVFFTEKISCRFANIVIAISPSLKKHAVDLGLASNHKCIVLNKGSSNGVDILKYSNDDSSRFAANQLKADLGIYENDFVLLFVGRVTKDKGVQETVEAFLKLNESYDNTKLIIAGPIEKDDPLPNEIYKQIKNNENIFYLGKLQDVKTVYSASDVLVLYSYREGFGNVVIEASSMGLPTIVANIPGLKDTTVHNKTGLKVQPKCTISLLDAFDYYYNNRDVLKEHGANGRLRVKRHFRNEIIWEKQLELYEKLSRPKI